MEELIRSYNSLYNTVAECIEDDDIHPHDSHTNELNLVQKISDYETQIMNSKNELSKKNQEIIFLNEQIDNFKEMKNELETNYKKLFAKENENLQEALKENTLLKEEIIKKTFEFDQVLGKKQKIEDEFILYKEENSKLIEDFNERINKLISEKSSIEKINEDLEKNISILKNEISQKKIELNQKNSKYNQVHKNYNTMKTLYNTSEMNIKNLKTEIQNLSTKETHLKEGVNVLISKMKNKGLNRSDIEDVLDDNIIENSNINHIFKNTDHSEKKPGTQSNFLLNESELGFKEPKISENYLISQAHQMDSYNDYNLNSTQIKNMIEDENIFNSENEEISNFEDFDMIKKKMVNSQSTLNDNSNIDLEMFQHKIEQEINKNINDKSLKMIELDSNFVFYFNLQEIH